MSEITQKATPSRAISWFDPRRRDISTWAFILNRITAIGLTVYLFLHLVVLGQLAQGPEAYDNFLILMKSPFMIFMELLVVAGGLIHGLNGIRIALNSFGIGVQYQKQMFLVVIAISIIATLIFGVRMFTA